eukprot:2753669-Prymnesium_polylepis.3
MCPERALRHVGGLRLLQEALVHADVARVLRVDGFQLFTRHIRVDACHIKELEQARAILGWARAILGSSIRHVPY